MKAATPVEKDNKSHQSKSKKQRQQEQVVVPLPEVEMAGTQTQKHGDPPLQAGSENPNNKSKSNGAIAPVHGSQTVYDQGSEIMYEKLQESLAQTGDINHPDTQEVEKSYMTTLNIDQIQDYQQLKSGTYLPQTAQEQATAHQEAKPKEKTKQKTKSAGKGNTNMALSDLANSPATQLAGNFNAVQNNSTTLLNSQAEKATGELPKVNAKIGSAFSQSKSKAKSKTNTDKTTAKSRKKTIKSATQKSKTQKEASFSQNAPLKKGTYSFKTTGAKSGGIEKQVQNQFEAIRLNTSAIPTTMQQSARLDLTGEADTEHLSIEQNDAAQDMSIQKNKAAKDIHKDHGENNIIKKPNDEVLKPSRKIKSKAVKKQPIEAMKLQGIDEANIDAQFEPMIQSKIGTENEKYQTAELEHNQKVLEHEKVAETKIGSEKDKSHQNQLKAVKDAQTDVNQSKTEWQNALDKTESDFARKSNDHAKTTLGNIKAEKSKGETKAQSHINKANEDARKKKEAADKEAEEKKAEKKNESKGFFGWLSDKATAFINALKDALNFIFTKLREAVKAIFDAAKKLVLEALEFARKAIVNFIKGFATLLKGFLDIALAAFPGIRDRLKAKIDKYVAVAEKFVNQTFEVFKKAVVAIIDFLADVVDTLIGALQDFYNLILDAVNFIVAGIIKIMEGLANLVSSAMVMPDNFMGQISEEFLGMDVTQPLPFEKTAMPEMASSGAGSDSEYSDLLSRNSYDENDFHVDPVPNDMELSPEILAQLQNSNGEINFGANDNTIDTFKQSAVGSEGSESQTEAQTENQNIPADPYAQADWFINYQNSQSPPSTDTESASGKQPATAGSMPEEMKLVGPWTPGVRMYYLKEQMWAGIKKNWAENKWKYIGIGAAIVLGITALAILTAGAIFALIPPALEIFAAIMMAQAVAKASGFFKTFMTDGWLGKTASAGKALARAIGIILVELIFILLFDSAALFKVLKTAAKGGVKGVFNLAKAGAKSTLKAGKNALVATGKGFVKQAGKAKFFVQGIGKGIAKGAKNLDELGENLAKRFKFKGFSLELKGRWFTLYGIINPKVPLAKGRVDDHGIEKQIKDTFQKVQKRSKEIDFGKGKIIRGFTSSGELAERLGRLKNLLKDYGRSDIKVGLRGSSLSGTSSKNGLEFFSNPKADLDFFIIDSKFITKHNLFEKINNATKSLKEEDLMKIDPGYLKILEEIFAKETKNQLGRKSTVRILSENALTGKEIIF
ncbi:hypothetical protein [Chryseobacterium lactis]|uniref:hypothetical protein n=1 Tax=Chryseobacterium lactis TaxID=1241981 RepID=UPI0016277276|nr:hypothetical protein [Chryseobacterium lactis]